jgi:radical SAM superfamily enzyme YgiQ (UPF0313 family)
VFVLLAAAPHRDTFGYSMPPPGLLRLGGALERAGFAVELEDLALRMSSGAIASDDRLADACADVLIERAASRGDDRTVIGISVMGATLPIALLIFERLRARRERSRAKGPRAPRAVFVLGGPGTTGVDVAIVERFACVDAVVRGEGEITMSELCAKISAGELPRGVHGVTWRDASGVVQRERDREPLRDLATLAPYAWHLLPPIAEYKRVTGEEDGLVPIDSGRGCVYDCSFCTIGRFWSRRSRTLPARMLADEVASLRAMPGAKSAYLCHDIFGANRGQAVAFCDEMLRRGIDVPWEARARIDHLDGELLELMGRAGCYRVLLGIESADAAVRARAEKGMRDDVDVLELVDDCARARITPILSFILGLPGEDEAALRKTLDLCAAASLRAGVNLSLHLVNPQPGCGLGEEFAARSRPVEGIPPDMAFGAGETAPERALIGAHPDLFSTWSLLPGDEAHLRTLHAIASTLPEILMRYPRTFALLRAHLEMDALDLWRSWHAHAKSFESFARSVCDDLVDGALRWEQALARQAARADQRSASADSRGPRARGEIVALDHDVPAALSALRDGAVRVAIESTPTKLCVVRSSRTRAVETLRISDDVAVLLSRLDGNVTTTELERSMPGFANVVERLVAAGLVELPNAASPMAQETVQA